jgi:predicted hydrocarbon binding protein
MKRRVSHPAPARSGPAARAPRLKSDGAGALSLGGVRYLLIRPATLAALQKSVERELGGRAADCLAAGGRDGGARATSRLAGTGRQRARRLTEMGGAIGWGTFRLERFDADGMVVTVRHSPFAEAYGVSAVPVCHLTRGVLESLANLTLGRQARVVESRCAAAGSDHCRFEARVQRPVPR